MQHGICTIPIECEILNTGCCYQFERLTNRQGKWRIVPFPASVAVLRHPTKGTILFDTGYSEHFFRASRSFPYRFYRWATPVSHSHNQSAVEQLRNQGIEGNEIKHIILSHFHGDHTGGLCDFPNATVYCSTVAYEHIQNKKGMQAVKQAFLPGTIPYDFSSRVSFVEQKESILLPRTFHPFKNGYDIWGDGSMIAVDLPGHAAGQIGVFFLSNGHIIFLCADASWSYRAIRDSSEPHPFAYKIMHSAKDFQESFWKISELHRHNPNIRIIATHCNEKEEILS